MFIFVSVLLWRTHLLGLRNVGVWLGIHFQSSAMVYQLPHPPLGLPARVLFLGVVALLDAHV